MTHHKISMHPPSSMVISMVISMIISMVISIHPPVSMVIRLSLVPGSALCPVTLPF